MPFLTKEILDKITSLVDIHDINGIHPKCLVNSKVISLRTGVTGWVIKVNSESMQEDRYDSIDISWDNGNVSHRVFLMGILESVSILISQDRLNSYFI